MLEMAIIILYTKLGTVLMWSGASTQTEQMYRLTLLNKSNAQKWKLSEVKYATQKKGHIQFLQHYRQMKYWI